jgi:hypothetical protein
VRKTPSWSRSWANFSRLQLHSHRNAWANLHFWANLTLFSHQLPGRPSKATAVCRRCTLPRCVVQDPGLGAIAPVPALPLMPLVGGLDVLRSAELRRRPRQARRDAGKVRGAPTDRW